MKVPSQRELELLGLVVQERSGREVAKLYEKETGSRIPYGTVYTLFSSMEERGWVTIRNVDEGDRRVRLIKIDSKHGAAALRAGQEHHKRLFGLAEGALKSLRGRA